MAVHLTRIYTKTGDDGTSALGDMSRTAKTGVRLGAFADVDEANCSIGVVLALGAPATEVADALVERGWVHRAADPTDRRATTGRTNCTQAQMRSVDAAQKPVGRTAAHDGDDSSRWAISVA